RERSRDPGVRVLRRGPEAPPEDRPPGAALRRGRPRGGLAPAGGAGGRGPMPRDQPAPLHRGRFPRALQERILSRVKRRGGQATLESVIEKVYPSREGYAEVRAHRAFARAMP